MTVYLLHLKQSLSRGTNASGKALEASHYIGYTDDLIGRILDHAEGHGARFTQVCYERGINFLLARVWEGKGANRCFERRLKNYKKAHLLCPTCDPGALERMKLEKFSQK
jgi:predicted GIY-YIG superfamily endonuclease